PSALRGSFRASSALPSKTAELPCVFASGENRSHMLANGVGHRYTSSKSRVFRLFSLPPGGRLLSGTMQVRVLPGVNLYPVRTCIQLTGLATSLGLPRLAAFLGSPDKRRQPLTAPDFAPLLHRLLHRPPHPAKPPA